MGKTCGAGQGLEAQARPSTLGLFWLTWRELCNQLREFRREWWRKIWEVVGTPWQEGHVNKKGEEIEGDSLSMSMSGLRKKREINGGVKLVESGNKIQNSQLNIQHGLGVVVGVKQPR
jgi:hypothetical protein